MKKLKRVFCTVVIGIACKLDSFSQIGKVSVGIERAPQISWIGSGGAPSVKTGQGGGDNYGLLLQYDFPGHLGVSANVIMANQKSTLHYAGQRFNLENKVLKVPLLLTYTANPLGQATMIWRIGPQMAFPHHASIKDNNSGPESLTFNHKAQWGMALYGGMRLYIVDFVSLNFGLRFDRSFAALFDGNYIGVPLPAGESSSLSFVFGVNILRF